MWLLFVSYSISAYLFGSVSFAYWVAKAKGIDLRQHGSGNLGATNVYRTLGLKFGILVFLLDGFKAWLPTLLAVHAFEASWMHIGVGFFAILGHTVPIFHRFRGGKGAAPGIGILARCAPMFYS